METVWELIPRRSRACSSFMAVVVLPDPEGPESSTTGLASNRLAMASAAVSSRCWYAASHSARNSAGSCRVRSKISLS